MQGFELYRIPHTISINKLRTFMHDFLKNVTYVDPPDHELAPDDIFFAQVAKFRTAKCAKYNEQILKIIKDNNAKVKGILNCLTRTHQINLICENNHEFVTTFDNLTRGRWCTYCSINAPVTTNIINNLVESRGYILLKEYISTDIDDIKKLEDPNYKISENTKPKISDRNRIFIKVKCPNESHDPYIIMWDNFKQGAGCTHCGRINTIKSRHTNQETLAKELKSFGLELVSEYKNIAADSGFKCTENHHFISAVDKIRRNNKLHGSKNKCPVCIINTFKYIKLVEPLDPKTELSKLILKFHCTYCNRSFENMFKTMQNKNIEKCGKGH